MKKIILASTLAGMLSCGAVSANEQGVQTDAKPVAAEFSWFDSVVLRFFPSPRRPRH